MVRRKELTGYRFTNLKFPQGLVGVVVTPRNISLKENKTAYMVAWKIYEKVKKSLRRAPLKVKVKYPRVIPSEELAFSLIPLAQSMLSHLSLRYNIGFIVSIREIVSKHRGNLSQRNLGELIILPTNREGSSSITLMRVNVVVHRYSSHSNLSIHRANIMTKKDTSGGISIGDIRGIVRRAGYSYYYVVEKPLVLMDILFPSLEDVIRIVIEDGVEAINVAFPLREPKWSLQAFPSKLSEELSKVIINPLKSSAKYAAKGLLVIGPPGVGKSVLVEAIARELGVKLLELSPGSYRSMWYGLTEKILLKLFEKLRKRKDLVVLIDDAEFLSTRARSVHEVHLSEITMLLNILQRTDRPLIALTSNQPDIIDPALLRPGRIDVVVVMGYPGLEFRKIIVKETLKRYSIRPVEDMVEYIARSTRWFTNAEIDALIRLAVSLGNGILSRDVVDKAKRRFRINEGERRRIQEFLEWYASKMQGIVLNYISREDEM